MADNTMEQCTRAEAFVFYENGGDRWEDIRKRVYSVLDDPDGRIIFNEENDATTTRLAKFLNNKLYNKATVYHLGDEPSYIPRTLSYLNFKGGYSTRSEIFEAMNADATQIHFK